MTTWWTRLALLSMVSFACQGGVPVVVESTFDQLIPGVEAKNIIAAPLPGWYQGQIGSRLFYVSADARFLLDGQIFDLNSQQNLTEAALNGVRQELLRGVDESTMVVFKAPKERYQITVFTDVDCGYCRKLHNSMAAYHDRGISVRYLAYPRAGMGSKTAQIMQSAWCADDRAGALTLAKQGLPIESIDCTNPVAQHYQLGNDLGVNGTPAILFDSGQLVPGFMAAPQLLKMLEKG